MCVSVCMSICVSVCECGYEYVCEYVSGVCVCGGAVFSWVQCGKQRSTLGDIPQAGLSILFSESGSLLTCNFTR